LSEIDHLIEAAAEKNVDWANQAISQKLPENDAGNIKIWELLYLNKPILSNKINGLWINQGQLMRRLKSIPESFRKTMTYDQGSEMALHETLSAELNIEIFFCDPHIPWQPGSNENANVLVREFLPKGMYLSQVSYQQLTAIEHILNHRPRKILNLHSPHELSTILTAQNIAGFALQV
jgi:hypothetical protein